LPLPPPLKATFSDAVGSDGSDIGDVVFGIFPSQDPHSSPHPQPHPQPLAPFWLFTKPIAVELFIMSDDDEMTTTTLASGEERILENISHLHSGSHTDTRHAHEHRYAHTHTHRQRERARERDREQRALKTEQKS